MPTGDAQNQPVWKKGSPALRARLPPTFGLFGISLIISFPSSLPDLSSYWSNPQRQNSWGVFFGKLKKLWFTSLIPEFCPWWNVQIHAKDAAGWDIADVGVADGVGKARYGWIMADEHRLVDGSVKLLDDMN